MAPPRLASQNLRNFIETTQGKSYTVGAVTILLVIAIFIVGIFPALSSIFFQIEQNGNRAKALEQIELKRQTLRNLSATEEEKHALTLSLDANLPNQLDQMTLLSEVNQMISDSGCILIAITFNNLEAKRDFVSTFGASLALDGKQLNLTVEGDRTKVETFMSLLENSRRIFNIRNFSLFKRDDQLIEGTDTGTFKVDIQAEVYFWNKDKTK